MTHASAILAAIRSKGVALWVEAGQLRYRAPKGALTSGEIAALRAHKNQLIGLLADCPAAAAPDPLLAPVTFQQEWVWKWVQKSGSWNMLLYAFALRVVGELRCSLLQAAFAEVVRRHGALRTRIVTSDGVLKQQVEPQTSRWRFEIVPVADSTGIGQHAIARAWLERYFNRITNPETAAFFEVKILRLSESEHVLAVALHHIISDAYSISILFRELWMLYRELSLGQPSSLPRVSGQYVEYAHWQRQTESDWSRRHDGYWAERLAAAPRLRLPMKKEPMKKGPMEKGGEPGEAAGPPSSELKFRFDAALTTAVREMARREQSLPSLVVFSVYVAVVARLCDQRDLVLPFDITGRHLPEHENMFGFFSYYLNVRLRLAAGESFVQLLRTVGREVYEAIDHQDFTRKSQEVTDTLANTSFNWVAVSSSEISGVPAPGMLPDLRIEPFSFQRATDSPEEGGVDNVSDGYAALVFYDNGTWLEATVYHPAGYAHAAGEFMRELERAMTELLRGLGHSAAI